MLSAPRWIFFCTLGEFIGFASAGGIAYVVFTSIPDPTTLGLACALLAGCVLAGIAEGLSLGLGQWWALRGKFPELRARAWLGASVAAAAGGWILGGVPSTLISLLGRDAGSAAEAATEPSLVWLVGGSALGGVALGAAFGAIQWRTLRRHAPAARRWIASNALGWGLALPWSYVAGSSASAARSPLHALAAAAFAGLAMGFTVAVANWYALRAMR